MITVRPLRAADWRTVADITAEAYHGERYWDYSDADGDGLIAEVDGEVSGFILYWLGRPETWLREIAVRRTSKNQHVAAALLFQVARLAIAHGSRAVAGVLSHDQHAEMAMKVGAEVKRKQFARCWLNSARVQYVMNAAENVIELSLES